MCFRQGVVTSSCLLLKGTVPPLPVPCLLLLLSMLLVLLPMLLCFLPMLLPMLLVLLPVLGMLLSVVVGLLHGNRLSGIARLLHVIWLLHNAMLLNRLWTG